MGKTLSRPGCLCWNCCCPRKGQREEDDFEEDYVPQRLMPAPVSTQSHSEPNQKAARRPSWKFWKSRRAPVSQVLEACVSNPSLWDSSTMLTQHHPGQPNPSKPMSKESLSHGHQKILEACGSACMEHVKLSPCLSQELLDMGLGIPIPCQSCTALGGSGSPLASSAGCAKEVVGQCQEEDSAAGSQLSYGTAVSEFFPTDSLQEFLELEEQCQEEDSAAGSQLSYGTAVSEFFPTDSLQEFLELEERCLSQDEGHGAVPVCLEVQTIPMRPPSSRSNIMEDEDEGHPICQAGDVLSARYEVVGFLGEGTFGQVVQCIDHQDHGRNVAVKIAKEAAAHSKAAYREVRVMDSLKALDPSSIQHCLQMLDWFEYKGHVCIVSELLGLSTYNFLKENCFLPFRLEHIRHMAYQICKAVSFLHANKLTHTDLKPANILLASSDYTEEYSSSLKCVVRRLKCPDIKVADFGSTVLVHEPRCSLVTTRPYRAPEVILALGWSQPCDVWSIGCTLLEYYLGFQVFQISHEAHEDIEHLARMEQILGPLPRHMIKKTRRGDYFHCGRLAWDQDSFVGRYISWHCKPLKEFMTCSSDEHWHLFDLIEKMLEYDPAKRIALEEALKHPFFCLLQRQKRALPPGAEGADTALSPPKKSRRS